MDALNKREILHHLEKSLSGLYTRVTGSEDPSMQIIGEHGRMEIAYDRASGNWQFRWGGTRSYFDPRQPKRADASPAPDGGIGGGLRAMRGQARLIRTGPPVGIPRTRTLPSLRELLEIPWSHSCTGTAASTIASTSLP